LAFVRHERRLRLTPPALGREPADPPAAEQSFGVGLGAALWPLPPDLQRIEPGLEAVGPGGGSAHDDDPASSETLLAHRAARFATHVAGHLFLEGGAGELGWGVAGGRIGLEQDDNKQ
jgi:hypothetical protein